MPTLFDGLLGYQRQQQALIMDKQQVEDNALSLQAKMQGLKQQQAENEAIKQYDPSNIDSLQQVAGTLAQAGDAKGAMGVIKEYQDIKDKQALVRTRAISNQAEQFKIAGGILTGMDKSPEAYQAGLMQMMSSGLNPSQFGLTGSYDTDQPNIGGMAKSTIGAFQQFELDARNKANDRLIQNEADKLTYQKQQASFEERRVNAEEGRLKGAEDARKEKAKMDVLAQNKATQQLNFRKQAMAIPTPKRVEETQAMLSGDPRTEGASAGEKKILALRLANKASQAMARKMDSSDSDTDFDPTNYEEEVKNQFDKLVAEGGWGDKGRSLRHPFTGEKGIIQQGQKAQAAKQEAAGKVAPPQPKVVDPKTMKPGDFIPTPNGKKFKVIGKKPDGTPMIETDANGKPVYY